MNIYKSIKFLVLVAIFSLVTVHGAFQISQTVYAATVTVAPYSGTAKLVEEKMESSGFPYPEKRKYVKVTASPALPNGTSVTFTTSVDCFFFDDGMGGGLKGQSFTRNSYSGSAVAGIAATQDTDSEGPHSCTVTATLSSADSNYNGSKGKLVYSITDDEPALTKTENTSAQTEKTTQKPTTTTTKSKETPTAPKKPEVNSIQVGENTYTGSEKFDLEAGKPLVIKGETIPRGEVDITIYSEPKSYKATANDNGDYEVVVENIPEGDHHAEISVKDPENGLSSTPVKIAEFSVLAASTVPVTTVSTDASYSLPLFVLVAAVVLFVTIGALLLKKRASKTYRYIKARVHVMIMNHLSRHL